MSIQATLTNLLLRATFKPRPGTRVVVAQARAKMAQLARRNPPLPTEVKHTPVPGRPERGLCPAEWLEPAQGPAADARTVLYLHGGGYFFCNLDTHRPMCATLSRAARSRVLSVDYRLAPEHPCPAAIDDALAWYRELLIQQDASRLVIAGDSAGGGLALACLLAARDAGLPLPAAAALFSPWVDLACRGETLQTLARQDVMFQPDTLPQAAAFYLAGRPGDDPQASPLYADLRGLPPLLIFASRKEVLLSDATRLHERALAAGVHAQLRLERSLPHAWPTMPALPEARATLREAAAFFRDPPVAGHAS